MTKPIFSSPVRTLLQRKLMDQKKLLAFVDRPWRVKKMTDTDLLELAKKLDVDVSAIEASLRSNRPVVPVAPSDEVTPKMDGHSFYGTLRFPIAIEALGRRVEKKYRIKWAYTPSWPHLDANGQHVNGGPECFTFQPDVLLEIDDNVAWEVVGLPRGEAETVWARFDLLEWGLFPSDFNAEIEERIDDDARRQNAERRAKRAAKATG